MCCISFVENMLRNQKIKMNIKCKAIENRLRDLRDSLIAC